LEAETESQVATFKRCYNEDREMAIAIVEDKILTLGCLLKTE